MLCQTESKVETFSTLITLVGFLVIVSSLVNHEMLVLSKLFPTLPILKRFLASVSSFMFD